MQNLRKTNETGRSMVEMLGVLAIIGVLSVAGVAGYKAAVRKALANNLLNQASMRATDVATQIGSGNLDSLGNDAFDGNLGSGVTMTPGVKGPDGYTDYDETDEQFTLTLEGLDEELCQQMQSMAGGSRSVVRAVLCDGDKAILTFNKDLSSNPVASDFDGNKEGCESSGRKYCDNDICIPATEECPITKPACPTGTFVDGEGGFATKLDDGSMCYCETLNTIYNGTTCEAKMDKYCSSYKECNAGEYCQYDLKWTGCSGPRSESFTGCAAIPEGEEYNGFWMQSSYRDWFSAQDICQAKGMKMVSVTDVGCSQSDGWLSTCSDTNTPPLWQKLGDNLYHGKFWTQKSDDCNALFVDTENNGWIDRAGRNNASARVLCKSVNICANVKLNECQASCETQTGEILNKEDGTICDGGDGVCVSGSCVENRCLGVQLDSCQSSCNPETGEITYKADGTECVMSNGKNGVCHLKECSAVCQTYNDCEENQFCQIDSVYGSGEKLDSGFCKSLSHCGSLQPYTASNGRTYWVALVDYDNCAANRWNAEDICLAKNMKLASLEDINCARSGSGKCPDTSSLPLWQELGQNLSAVYVWLSNTSGSSNGYDIGLGNGSVYDYSAFSRQTNALCVDVNL